MVPEKPTISAKACVPNSEPFVVITFCYTKICYFGSSLLHFVSAMVMSRMDSRRLIVYRIVNRFAIITDLMAYLRWLMTPASRECQETPVQENHASLYIDKHLTVLHL